MKKHTRVSYTVTAEDAAFVAAIRKRKQTVVAQAIGVRDSYLSDILKGRRKMPEVVAEAIVGYLDDPRATKAVNGAKEA